MDETRVLAHPANLDIEILHRRLPDERAEQLLISLLVGAARTLPGTARGAPSRGRQR